MGGGGVCAQGGVCPGGCLPGGSAQRDVCLGGVYTPRTEFLTHACENITFPQLRLRTVNMENIRCKWYSF